MPPPPAVGAEPRPEFARRAVFSRPEGRRRGAAVGTRCLSRVLRGVFRGCRFSFSSAYSAFDAFFCIVEFRFFSFI